MRKSMIDTKELTGDDLSVNRDNWLDLDAVATVEITSEDPLFPIEQALGNTPGKGWRSAATGPQIIRLNFDKLTSIDRIALHFVERAAERSQEFAIYAKSEGQYSSAELREVIRQQFTFTPGGATEETEDYMVALNAVSVLELRIDPDRAHNPKHSQHYATLQSLRLA